MAGEGWYGWGCSTWVAMTLHQLPWMNKINMAGHGWIWLNLDGPTGMVGPDLTWMDLASCPWLTIWTDLAGLGCQYLSMAIPWLAQLGPWLAHCWPMTGWPSWPNWTWLDLAMVGNGWPLLAHGWPTCPGWPWLDLLCPDGCLLLDMTGHSCIRLGMAGPVYTPTVPTFRFKFPNSG